MNPDAMRRWLREQGVVAEEPDEPWPLSPVAPISPRARQAFKNLGIMD